MLYRRIILMILNASKRSQNLIVAVEYSFPYLGFPRNRLEQYYSIQALFQSRLIRIKYARIEIVMINLIITG